MHMIHQGHNPSFRSFLLFVLFPPLYMLFPLPGYPALGVPDFLYGGYRAVASYVTTVNQLYISLLFLGYLRYLLRLCGKRVVRCTMNSEMRAAWNLSFYYVNYHYSTVIVLGKSNEYCAEIVS